MPAGAPPDRIIAGFLRVYEEAEYETLRALADAVAKGVKARGRADLVTQAAQATELRGKAAAIARRLNTTVSRAIPETLEQAMLDGGRRAVADLDEAFGPDGRSYTAVLNRGPLDQLARSLSDTLTPAHLSITRVVDDAYKQIIGASAVGVLTGTQTRVEATQRAMDRFAAAGITGFTDRAGRNWQLSSYAEMAIRASTARAALDAHVERLVSEGVTLAYVSDSPEECALCRPFEHKIVVIAGEADEGTITVPHALTDDPIEVDVVGTLASIRARGFMHPNCTHSIAMYLPGVTRLRSSTENPQGYADRQQLRALERNVRAAKRVEAAALSPDAARTAAVRVRACQAAIREHVNTTSAKRQPHREQLVTGNAADAVTPAATIARGKADTRREQRRAAKAARLEADRKRLARNARDRARRAARRDNG